MLITFVESVYTHNIMSSSEWGETGEIPSVRPGDHRVNSHSMHSEDRTWVTLVIVKMKLELAQTKHLENVPEIQCSTIVSRPF